LFIIDTIHLSHHGTYLWYAKEALSQLLELWIKTWVFQTFSNILLCSNNKYGYPAINFNLTFLQLKMFIFKYNFVFEQLASLFLFQSCSDFTVFADIEQVDSATAHQGEHFHIVVHSCWHFGTEEGYPACH
jgi:hypothetical protein